MKRLLVIVGIVIVAAVCIALGCGCGAAGFRFKAGVDVQLTKVVQDSTRTVSVTRSATEPQR